MATLIAVYSDWGFANIRGIGWGWAGVIWLYSIIFYVPLDFFKFFIRYALSGRAWDTLLQNKVRKVCICRFYFLYSIAYLNLLYGHVSIDLFVSLELSRLLSQPKRIMDGERGRPNGLWHNVHCMASRRQMTRRSLMRRTATGSCQKSRNRPRDALKLQGNYMVWRVDSVRYCFAFFVFSSFIFFLGFGIGSFRNAMDTSNRSGCFRNSSQE